MRRRARSTPVTSDADSFSALRDDPLRTLQELSELGDFVPFRVGRQEAFLVTAASAIRELLVSRNRWFTKQNVLMTTGKVMSAGATGLMSSSDPDDHVRGRKLVSPSFASGRTRAYLESVSRHSASFADVCRKRGLEDVVAAMTSLTAGITTESVFGAPLSSERNTELAEASAASVESFALVAAPGFALRNLLRIREARRFWRAQQTLEQFVDAAVLGGGSGGDVVAASAQAKPAADVTAQQRRSDLMAILLAGVETTSMALTWTCVLLARHPEVQERLREEARGVLDGADPAPRSLEQVPFARAVFAEALRLYPPSWYIGRRASGEQTLAGHIVPAETVILVSPYLAHRDERNFERAGEFLPGRWASDGTASTELTYFPFGAGPRQCLGERLAWLEGMIVPVHLVHRGRLVLDGPLPGVRAGASLAPDRRVRMRLEPI